MQNPKRSLIILLVTFSLVALYFVLGSELMLKADASGGVFTSTKHGGGTVDGEPHVGVDRSVNPDHFPYYNSNEAGAGKYESGECSHCHEPHASFGASSEVPPLKEPLPTGGPTAYILMQDTYNSATEGENSNLCWYCHEEINWDPFYGGGIGRWKFYQGKDLYNLSGHANASVDFAWPGAGVATDLFPRRDRSGYAAANDESCVNCHTPHGIGGTGIDIGAQTTTNYTASAAEPGSNVVQRQLIAREEALCLRCHDSDGPAAADIHTDINNRVNSTTGSSSIASGHAVRSYFQKHNLFNEDDFNRVSGWNSADWHVECTDCHNPHRATKGPADATKAYSFQRSGDIPSYNTNRGGGDTTAGQVEISDANLGVWGLTVNAASLSDGTPYSTSYDGPTDEPTYVYELCLKCHSVWGGALDNTSPSTTRSVANTPVTTPFTDVGAEFDPDNCNSGNGAIHPLFAKGCNQPPTGANSAWTGAGRRADIPTVDEFSQNFVPPWTKDSFVTCVDCHRGNAAGPYGPHGSTRPFILATLDTSITYDICTDGGPGACTGTATVDYSTYYPAGGKAGEELSGKDPNNLCLNCHRVDIYGFFSQADDPGYHAFSRHSHPADAGLSGGGGGGQAFQTTQPRGIVCLLCHGGRILGGIHGLDTSVARGQNSEGAPAGANAGLRFIYGTKWRGYDKATTAVNGVCYRGADAVPSSPNGTGGTFAVCTQHGDDSASSGTANYDY